MGGQCPSGAQNLSGFPQFPSGHWALGLQKLPLVRFRFGAWLCRANVPGAGYAVGAGALTRPQAFPCPPLRWLPLWVGNALPARKI